ncbi:MAG TPA: YceD family protein [Fibrobacteria bacterium]|nr:YceD family protein [Fibrobacteria bacterium]HOX51004.1 YceD family protein [Fibrobacteria bacterium]
MKGSQASSPLRLPIVKWVRSRTEIDLRFPAREVPELVEAEVVGEVHLTGVAENGPKDTVVKFDLTCHTLEICGRSLESFEHPLSASFQLLLHRSGACTEVEWNDESEEIFEATIPEDQRELDIADVVRQVVELERPISPIKPGVSLPEGVLPEATPQEESPIDPRWAKLAGLKDKLS